VITTEKVAKLILDFKYESIPLRGLEQSKAAVIDSLGAGLLGAKEPVAKAVAEIAFCRGGAEEAQLWGFDGATSLSNAVLINSISMHCMDYDNGGSLGHPAALMIPTALALAEKHRLSGKAVIEAYAAGYELGAKLRDSLGDIQHEAGFHATSLLGSICSAAVAAKLMGMDVQKTRMALSIAACLGSGLVQSFGTDSKPVQVGRAAESGMLAALLAERGCTGDPHIFEEAKGFYYVYGQEEAAIRRLTENFGKPVAVAAERGHFKQWASCGGNYEVLSVLYDLLDEEDIDPDQISDIVVALSMTPPGPSFRSNPRTAMEGRFSLSYNVASCLIDGKVDLDTFTDEKFRRQAVHGLMEKVRVVGHPECEGKPKRLQNESRFIELTIWLKDGQVISRRQDAVNRKQLSAEETYVKFADIGHLVGLPADAIAGAARLVQNYETCEDASEPVRLIRDSIV